MHNEKGTKQLNGFSLFEIIVTLGILLIITVVVFPIAVNQAGKTKLESYANKIATDIYYQQQRSLNRNLEQGILVQSSRYILFDGEGYSSSTDTDIKNLPANIRIHSVSLSSGNEILFEKGSFKPIVYGSLVVSDGIFSYRVYINREGLIVYEEV
jgi:type II secretory pathway pseudopilin PulG